MVSVKPNLHWASSVFYSALSSTFNPSGKEEVTGANVLVAIFSEQESQAVYILKKADVTRLDVVNYISHGVTKNEDETSSVDADEDNAEGEENTSNLGQIFDQP